MVSKKKSFILEKKMIPKQSIQQQETGIRPKDFAVHQVVPSHK
jgi:hypothetical protein